MSGVPFESATGFGDEVLPSYASDHRSYGWWGMVLLICTEAALFGTLLASYFYVSMRADRWPPSGIEKPSLALPVVMSLILWSSSIPVHLAERSAKKGDQRGLRRMLAAGFLLGAVFLALQVGVEYPETLKEFSPQTNVYGSFFFLITGLHGIHVFVGLCFSAWTQVRARMGAFDRYRHLTVTNFVLYWHFVDVVWLGVFFALYLSPHL